MSTLTTKDFQTLDKQLENAKDKTIDKVKVLSIIQRKLKEVDMKNSFIVDRIDGAVLKEILNEINKL